MPLLERGGSHVHGPRNHAGLGLDVEVVAEIDDEHGLAGRQLRLELLGADPRDAQLAEEELAARHLDAQIGPEGADDDHDGPAAQAVGETAASAS